MKSLILFILLNSVLLVSVESRILPLEVISICERYNKVDLLDVDCNLVVALVYKESSFVSQAYHPEKTGSYGLMQIQCGTAKARGLKYGCDQLFNPKINIRFGMRHIKWIKDYLIEPKMSEIISAYNAGFQKDDKLSEEVRIKCLSSPSSTKIPLNTKDNGCLVGRYKAIRCENYNKFQWHDFPAVECFPGEYINEEYVWKVMRYYKYIKRR